MESPLGHPSDSRKLGMTWRPRIPVHLGAHLVSLLCLSVCLLLARQVPLFHDDIPYRADVSRRGVWGFATNQYSTWNGRFGWAILEGIAMKLPVNLTRQVPLAVWLLVWSGLGRLIRALAASKDRPALFTAWSRPWPNAVAASGIVTVASIQLNGARVEAMFWVTGCLTYFVPIGLFAHGTSTLLLAQGLHHSRTRQALGLSVVAFAASCSESVSMTALVFLFVLLAHRFIERRTVELDPLVLRIMILTALIATVFCVVAFAPGHNVRKDAEGFVGIPALKSLLIGMDFTTRQLIRFAVRPEAGPAILIVGAAAGLAIRPGLFRSSGAILKLLAGSATLSLWAGHTMALIGTGQPMIPRALTASFMLFAALILAAGFVGGQWLAAYPIMSVRSKAFVVPCVVLALALSRPAFNRTGEHLSQLRLDERALAVDGAWD
jgi:hypothetical protein